MRIDRHARVGRYCENDVAGICARVLVARVESPRLKRSKPGRASLVGADWRSLRCSGPSGRFRAVFGPAATLLPRPRPALVEAAFWAPRSPTPPTTQYENGAVDGHTRSREVATFDHIRTARDNVL